MVSRRALEAMCQICGQTAGEEVFIVGIFSFELCGACGSASLVPGQAPADYEAPYFHGGGIGGYFNYETDDALHRETANARLNAIAGYLPANPRVVDVGAGLGYTLDEGRDRGWSVVGVDVSQYAASVARLRGHEVVARIQDLDTATFDAVIFGQVLEHMLHPEEELHRAIELLVPGGVIFVETWDLHSKTAKQFGRRWQQISPPSVIHLFTLGGLKMLCARQDVTVLETGTWSKRVSIGGYVGVVATKLPAAIGRLLVRGAEASGLSRKAVRYRFDDLVYLIAQKPRQTTPPSPPR